MSALRKHCLCSKIRWRGSVNDPEHSAEERREIIIGQSRVGRLLLVSFTERGEIVRIISARVPDRDERKRYEEENL